eukprot:UN10105
MGRRACGKSANVDPASLDGNWIFSYEKYLVMKEKGKVGGDFFWKKVKKNNNISLGGFLNY